ncbi:MAG: hypothetical protein QM711_04075 [Micropruina sp.]|uniref:hypothetical protein n=1 Tax=Micropruina sp. TaxID=2737536 RepID=UPI0039E4D9BF
MSPVSRTAPEGPTVAARRLPSLTERSRWEVVYGCEATGWAVIGWVEERALGRAKSRFYFATGIHPVTGKHYRLEGSTDFDERVNVVGDFHIDPMTSRQHLGLDGR